MWTTELNQNWNIIEDHKFQIIYQPITTTAQALSRTELVLSWIQFH